MVSAGDPEHQSIDGISVMQKQPGRPGPQMAWEHMGVSINSGTPNGWFIVDIKKKMDDLGVALL